MRTRAFEPPNGDRSRVTYNGAPMHPMLRNTVIGVVGLIIASIDPATGKLSLAKGYGLDFNRPKWPHGKTGPAVPNGAVFVLSTPALADKTR